MALDNRTDTKYDQTAQRQTFDNASDRAQVWDKNNAQQFTTAERSNREQSHENLVNQGVLPRVSLESDGVYHSSSGSAQPRVDQTPYTSDVPPGSGTATPGMTNIPGLFDKVVTPPDPGNQPVLAGLDAGSSGAPAQPGNSAIPGTTDAVPSGAPAVPGAPSVPGTPATPGAPALPGTTDAAAAGNPAAPVAPDALLLQLTQDLKALIPPGSANDKLNQDIAALVLDLTKLANDFPQAASGSGNGVVAGGGATDSLPGTAGGATPGSDATQPQSSGSQAGSDGSTQSSGGGGSTPAGSDSVSGGNNNNNNQAGSDGSQNSGSGGATPAGTDSGSGSGGSGTDSGSGGSGTDSGSGGSGSDSGTCTGGSCGGSDHSSSGSGHNPDGKHRKGQSGSGSGDSGSGGSSSGGGSDGSSGSSGTDSGSGGSSGAGSDSASGGSSGGTSGTDSGSGSSSTSVPGTDSGATGSATTGNGTTAPPVDNTPLVPGGATITPGATFVEKNGLMYDPSGKQFIANGLTVTGDQALSQASQLVNQYHFNFLRVDTDGGMDSSGNPDFSKLDAIVNKYKGTGVALQFEYPGGPNNDELLPSGELPKAEKWYAAVAQHYANNPYVWLGTINESGSTDSQGYLDQTTGIIKAISSTGNKNPILAEDTNWAEGAIKDPGSSALLKDAKAIQGASPFGNVVATLHFYEPGDTQGETSKLLGAIDSLKKAGYSPMINEFGVFNTGNPNGDQGSFSAVLSQAAMQAGVGYAGYTDTFGMSQGQADSVAGTSYANQHGIADDKLVNPDGSLSTYGQQLVNQNKIEQQYTHNPVGTGA